MSISATELAADEMVAITSGQRFRHWCRNRFPHRPHGWFALLVAFVVLAISVAFLALQIYYPTTAVPRGQQWWMLGLWLIGLFYLYFYLWGIPREANAWTKFFTFTLTIGIPGWFFGAHMWNPTYQPSAENGWVWAVPACAVLLHCGVDIGLLFLTLEDRLRRYKMMHFFSSAAPFLVTFGTMLVIITLHFAVGYALPQFLAYTLLAVLWGTSLEGAWNFFIPYFINSRNIINQGGGGGGTQVKVIEADHDHPHDGDHR